MTPPPIGVIPKWLWDEWVPEPTAEQRDGRRAEVAAAADRYKSAGLAPRAEWLKELEVAHA